MGFGLGNVVVVWKEAVLLVMIEMCLQEDCLFVFRVILCSTTFLAGSNLGWSNCCNCELEDMRLSHWWLSHWWLCPHGDISESY